MPLGCGQGMEAGLGRPTSRRADPRSSAAGRSTPACTGRSTTGQPLARSKLVNVWASWPLKMCSGTMKTPTSWWNVK